MDRICIWEMLKFWELLFGLIFCRTASHHSSGETWTVLSSNEPSVRDLYLQVNWSGWVWLRSRCCKAKTEDISVKQKKGWGFLEKVFLYQCLACNKSLLQTKPCQLCNDNSKNIKVHSSLQFTQCTKYTDTKSSKYASKYYPIFYTNIITWNTIPAVWLQLYHSLHAWTHHLSAKWFPAPGVGLRSQRGCHKDHLE